MAKNEIFNLEENSSSEGEDFVSLPQLLRSEKDLILKDLYSWTDTEFSNYAGQRIAIAQVSGATYSVAASDYLVAVSNLGVAPTIGLPRPSLVRVGKTFNVKDQTGGAGTTTITVVSQGEETIDGATSLSISTNYASYSFYTDGANWFIY